MAEDLKHFRTLIGNREKALQEGRIVPRPGLDADYDQSLETIEQRKQDLNDYLAEVRRKLRCPQVAFMKAVKTPYFLEIPEDITHSLSADYELKSKKQVGSARCESGICSPGFQTLHHAQAGAAHRRPGLCPEAECGTERRLHAPCVREL